jgi:anti-sigma B factor antagonist
MSITHRQLAGNIYLVHLAGPLNVTHADEVNRHLTQLAGKGVKRVVVDLAGVPFIDGPGLEALVTGYKLFGRKNFRLAGLQDQPRLVLELTGFDNYFLVLAAIPDAAPAKLSGRSRTPAYVTPLAAAANPA